MQAEIGVASAAVAPPSVATSERRVCGLTLNWNRWPQTVACLESLAAQSVPLAETVVVDNGSTDDSVEQLHRRFPAVRIIQSPHNLGFAAGCNLGLAKSLEWGYDYTLLVNNDATLAPEALARLLRAAQPGVGILTPKIFYTAHPRRIWSIGAKRQWLTLERTGDARGREDDRLAYTVRECDYLMGCGMLLSRTLLAEVGLFDPHFFMYYEDADLCLRARRAGFRLVMVADAHLWHEVAASIGGADSPGERYHMAKSSVLFFRKHVRGPRWLIVAPYRLGSALKTTLRLVRSGRRASARAYWRGLLDGLRASF